MLGKLARYLRILGYDTYYSSELKDSELLEVCNMGRILLTSDKGLYQTAVKRSCQGYLIPPGVPMPKLLAMLAKEGLIELNIDIRKSRCPICNGELAKDTDEARLPTLRRETYKCNNCGNIYWIGSHWRTLLRVLNEAKLYVEGIY